MCTSPLQTVKVKAWRVKICWFWQQYLLRVGKWHLLISEADKAEYYILSGHKSKLYLFKAKLTCYLLAFALLLGMQGLCVFFCFFFLSNKTIFRLFLIICFVLKQWLNWLKCCIFSLVWFTFTGQHFKTKFIYASHM